MSRHKASANGKMSNKDKIDKLVRDLISEPDRWLDTENSQLAGKRPRDLIGTSREVVLLDLLKAIEQGMFS